MRDDVVRHITLTAALKEFSRVEKPSNPQAPYYKFVRPILSVLDVRNAARLLSALADSGLPLDPHVQQGVSYLCAALLSGLRSHAFGPQEAFTTITSLQQLSYSPGSSWMFAFMSTLVELAQLMTPQLLSASIQAAGFCSCMLQVGTALPVEAQRHIGSRLDELTRAAAGKLSDSEQAAMLQGITRLLPHWDQSWMPNLIAACSRSSPAEASCSHPALQHLRIRWVLILVVLSNLV